MDPAPVATPPGSQGNLVTPVTFRVTRSTRTTLCLGPPTSQAASRENVMPDTPLANPARFGDATRPTTRCVVASTRLTSLGLIDMGCPCVPARAPTGDDRLARTVPMTAPATASSATPATTARRRLSLRRTKLLP